MVEERAKEGAIALPALPPNTKLHLEEAEEITYNEYTGELRFKKAQGFVWERYEQEFGELSNI